MIPLTKIPEGANAEIAQLNGKEQARAVNPMGIRVGKHIEMILNKRKGPLLLKVDETRIAIGRGMAMKILVHEK
ncbi:MAG: ferrous iron transport protein A [Acidobacteria bacterium]|nr:MAG: ferrous iron transport protein A [Acidobacteriota bacterium]